MTTRIISYNSYEEMNEQYGHFMSIIQRGLELGYNFNYEVTKENNQIKIVVKQSFKLN